MNLTERDEGYIQSLEDFIRREYDLRAVCIAPTRRGFYGETWRIEAPDRSYFLKLVYYAAHQGVYERSFPVVEHLCDHGIDFIGRIIKTADGRLCTRFDGAVLGVFEWIDGENRETDETKIPEYRMLAKVYTVPVGDLQMPREDFAGESAEDFFAQWSATTDERMLALLEKNRDRLKYRAERLKHFADLCRGDEKGFVITHGDAGGNFIVSGDRNFIVDWDGVLLAPPERDAWVMGFRDWAGCLFEKSLRQEGIDYRLRTERLAYYGYYMFFYWLTSMVRHSRADEVEEYFDGWGEERIGYADRG